MTDKITWIPYTPAGTVLFGLEAETENEAWANLLEAADHMPYGSREAFVERGYTVQKYDITEGD